MRTPTPSPSPRPARKSNLPLRLNGDSVIISKSAPASLKRRSLESSCPVVIQKTKSKKKPKKSVQARPAPARPAQARPAPATPAPATPAPARPARSITAQAATPARGAAPSPPPMITSSSRVIKLPARYREDNGPSTSKNLSKKKKTPKKIPKKKVPKKKDESKSGENDSPGEENSDDDEDSAPRKFNQKKTPAPHQLTVVAEPVSRERESENVGESDGESKKKNMLKKIPKKKEDSETRKDERSGDESSDDDDSAPRNVNKKKTKHAPSPLTVAAPSSSGSDSERGSGSDIEMESSSTSTSSGAGARGRCARKEKAAREKKNGSGSEGDSGDESDSDNEVKSLSSQCTRRGLQPPGSLPGVSRSAASQETEPPSKKRRLDSSSEKVNTNSKNDDFEEEEEEEEEEKDSMVDDSEMGDSEEAGGLPVDIEMEEPAQPTQSTQTSPNAEAEMKDHEMANTVQPEPTRLEHQESSLLQARQSEPPISASTITFNFNATPMPESVVNQTDPSTSSIVRNTFGRPSGESITQAFSDVFPTFKVPRNVKQVDSVKQKDEDETPRQSQPSTSQFQQQSEAQVSPFQQSSTAPTDDFPLRHGEVVKGNQMEREQHDNSTPATSPVEVEQLEESPEAVSFSEIIRDIENQNRREYFEALSCREDSVLRGRASVVRDVRNQRSESRPSLRQDSERPVNSDSGSSRRQDSFEGRRQYEVARREENQLQEARSNSRGPGQDSRKGIDVDRPTERQQHDNSTPATSEVKVEQFGAILGMGRNLQNKSRQDAEATSRRQDSASPSRASETRDVRDPRLDSRSSHRPDSERPGTSDSSLSRQQNSFGGRRQHEVARREENQRQEARSNSRGAGQDSRRGVDLNRPRERQQHENSTPATREIKKEEPEESPEPEVLYQSRRVDIHATSRHQDSVSRSRASEPSHRSDSRSTSCREERHHGVGRSVSRASEVTDSRNQRSDSRSSRRADSERPGTSDSGSSRRQDSFEGSRQHEEVARREENQRHDVRSRGSSGQSSSGDGFRRQPETDRRAERTSHGNYGNNDNRSRNNSDNCVDERRVVNNQRREDIPSTSKGSEARRSDNLSSEKNLPKKVVGNGQGASYQSCFLHVKEEARELLRNEGICDVREIEEGKASYIKSDPNLLTSRDLEELAIRQARTLRARSERGQHPISQLFAGYVKFHVNDLKRQLGLQRMTVGEKVYMKRYQYVFMEGEVESIQKARLELDEMCLDRLDHDYNEEKGNAEHIINYIHHVPEEVAEKMRFQRVFQEARRRVERCGVQITHFQNRHTEEDNPPIEIHGRANRIREGMRCLDNFIEELTSQNTLQIQVPMNQIGMICGHKRSTMNEIERVTRTIISVDPHSGEVNIEGGSMEIQEAKAQIREIIDRRQERKADSEEMEIPGNSISGMIGLRGDNINRIRKISGATIIIPSKVKEGETTAIITISGDPEQILKARIEIEKHLEEMKSNNRGRQHRYYH